MSAQNEPSGHGSLPVQGAFSIAAQPAEARQAAEAELHPLISRLAAAHLQLIRAVRERLSERLPTAHEVVYEYKEFLVISYSPRGRGCEGVLAIRASADGVKHNLSGGKELPDPERLLQGSGKATWWIRVDDAATLDRPAVAHLIEEPIARNPVPFALAGQGRWSFVRLRPTRVRTAGKRRLSGIGRKSDGWSFGAIER